MIQNFKNSLSALKMALLPDRVVDRPIGVGVPTPNLPAHTSFLEKAGKIAQVIQSAPIFGSRLDPIFADVHGDIVDFRKAEKLVFEFFSQPSPASKALAHRFRRTQFNPAAAIFL